MYIPDDSEKRSRPESVFWTTPLPVKWTTPKNGVVQISKMDDSATKWTTPVQNGRLHSMCMCMYVYVSMYVCMSVCM